MSFAAEPLSDTPDQRPQQPLHMVLLGTWGCHLCDDAASVLQLALTQPQVAAAIARVAGQAATLEYQQLDIVDDPDLFAHYRYSIPVLRLGKTSDINAQANKPCLPTEDACHTVTSAAANLELCWPFQLDDVVQALLALLEPAENYQSHHANHCE